MSMRTRSSKKEASASTQLAASQSIKNEEQSSPHKASGQPSVGRVTVDSQIKTYRQTLQQEIDKQSCMQTLPGRTRLGHAPLGPPSWLVQQLGKVCKDYCRETQCVRLLQSRYVLGR
ncbi:hypothetical protein CRG98_003959 [Punica granatum]|uniref:Uncharacterized protein n=1 Tax=Punica granatum TaxID=22663 RepID=A0A2I0L4Q8_PUNGR|nr:hypothetical protein CRG98_003959 [Punica granatum]